MVTTDMAEEVDLDVAGIGIATDQVVAIITGTEEGDDTPPVRRIEVFPL